MPQQAPDPASPAGPSPLPERRRVLHVCPYMHPSAGGPPVVVERLATHCAAFGWDAAVLTTSLMCGDNGRALAADLGARLSIEVLPVDRPRILGHASRAEAAMDAAVRAADVVHVHTLWHPLNGVARRACARHGKPYVLSPHGMLDPYALGVRGWRKRAYLALIERQNLAAAARILFTTAAERDLAPPRFGRAAPHEVIALGADQPPPGSGAERRAAFLRTWPGGADGKRILFLSRLHPKKGIEVLLRAMPRVLETHPDAHLFVAGAGAPAFEAGLRRCVAARGLSSSVTFTGFLSGEAKWSAMAAADLFVLPSLQENFGIAVAEAMHAALPVIVSRQVNISAEVEEAGAGIVLSDPRDEVALALAICRLLGEGQMLRRSAMRGRECASVRYDWSSSARRHAGVYDVVAT